MDWSLDPSPSAPGAVRRQVRAVLSDWELDDQQTEDVVLVINELVANVVDHAGTRMTVTIDHSCGVALVAVADLSDVQPHLQPSSTRAVRGRGLQLVDALSKRWGITPASSGPGKTVWAEIAHQSSTTLRAAE
jgi:anti-sigma regulatory factor (Ser/Thr protein kinase)